MNHLLSKYKSLTTKFKRFHAFQQHAIKAVLSGFNSLVIAPTGKGKSLIYQIAGQELPGLTIVVSPLIALINEQADFLGKDLALTLSSSLPFASQRELLRDFANGKHTQKFIFLSPERLQNYFFRSALKKSGAQISLIVVDEAHCISQWGSDFRPEYDQISQFSGFLNEIGQKPAILCMTATIGEKPKLDIQNEFDIDMANIYHDDDILRPELELNFIEVAEEREKFQIISGLLAEHQPKKALVYFYDIPNCEGFCKKLEKLGHKAGRYYAGMDSDDKQSAYSSFRKGDINVLCATTAFGMGMNIPDIDLIIHHRMPNSIEEYYQQAGRAARDKNICPFAKCFLIWSEANFDFKFKEHIPAVVLEIQDIDKAFHQLGLKGKSNIPQSIEYADYISQNLGRLRYCFEKRGLLKTIGELNGTPKTIQLTKPDEGWDEIVRRMDYGNSFIRAASNSGLTLQELIDMVFTKELNGEIKKFPAREKKIFFVSDYNEIPLKFKYEIIEESLVLSEFKENQVNDLIGLIRAEDPQGYIKNYFNRN